MTLRDALISPLFLVGVVLCSFYGDGWVGHEFLVDELGYTLGTFLESSPGTDPIEQKDRT